MDRYGLALLLAMITLGVRADGSPLTGRVWMPSEARFVEPAEVERAVARARFVLLGEEHPIARHHELQARLVRKAARGRRPAVVFEMIPASQQGAIDAWRAGSNPDPETLGPAVDWSARGWPDWALYAPIARAALDRGLPLLAGAPAPDRLQAVARAGLEGIDAGRRRALGLNRPLPPEARARLLATLRKVHCGELHAPAERMLAIQRLRDASMAARLRAAGRSGGAILIAGHGHVRHDYGVPRYLAGENRVVAIAFRTTGGPGSRIEDHVAAAGGVLPYDYVWFTDGETPGSRCKSS